MEKTLRELARAHKDALDAYNQAPSDSGDMDRHSALVRAENELSAMGGEQIIDALDAERAAALEEVRAWLEERAGELERQLAADHHDSHKHGGADEVRVLTYRFTRRFLAGKEGA